MSSSPTLLDRAQIPLADRRVQWAIVGVAALAAAGLLLWGTRQGAAISPDSATYVAGARNLLAGRGYSNYQLLPISDWPPGFSITLAIAQQIGISALTAARWLNALALGAIVVLTFILACRYVRRPALALAAALIAGFSPAMLGVFSFVWSEPLFCVIVMCVLLLLERLASSTRSRPGLIVAAGLVAGVGFSYRYAGMTLVILVAASVAVASWRDGVAATVRRTAAALAAGVVVPIVVVAHNATHGSLTGQRLPSTESLHALLASTARFSSGWILAGHHVRTNIGYLLVVCVLAAIVIGIRLWIRQHGVRSRASAALFPVAAFVAGYALYIGITEFQTLIDPPDDRICSPMLAPGAIVTVVAIDALLDHPWARRSRALGVGTGVIVVLWIAAMAHGSLTMGRANGGSGVRFSADGQTTSHWTTSPFMAGLRALPPGIAIYANQPGGMYLATGIEPFAYAGQPQAQPPIPLPVQAVALKQTMARQRVPVYLAWSLPNLRPHLVNPNYLATHGVRLARVLTTPQGTIDKVVSVTP